MICPHCGAADIPSGSAVCPFCGRAIAPMSPGDRERPMPPAPTRRPYLLAGVLAAIVLALIVALVMLINPRNAVTQAPEALPPRPGPPVTGAPAPQPPVAGPPITQAPAVQPPAITPPAPDPNKAAVQAYIQRVGQIERQRQRIVTDLGPALMQKAIMDAGAANPLMGPLADLLEPDPEAARAAQEKAQSGQQPASQVQQLIDGYVNQLRSLDQQFRAIQPVPQPAFPFARAYAEALVQYAGAIVQISQALSVGASDPSQAQAQAARLSGMKGGLQLQAEQGLQNADAQLTSLTGQYGLPKPFDITDTPRGAVTGG